MKLTLFLFFVCDFTGTAISDDMGTYINPTMIGALSG